MNKPQPSDDASRVEPDEACPNCGENRADELVWTSDGEDVRCSTCGTTYTPGTDPRPHIVSQ